MTTRRKLDKATPLRYKTAPWSIGQNVQLMRPLKFKMFPNPISPNVDMWVT